MNPEEAREEALRANADKHGGHTEYDAMLFSDGWDARGRYDEQRIAALERELAAANTLLKTTLALRALGQSEEVSGG